MASSADSRVLITQPIDAVAMARLEEAGLDLDVWPGPMPIPAEELAELKKQLSAPTNSVETRHVQEARAWEYVARAFLHKYRFDTLFRANRMGNIMHHIMGGPAAAGASN